MKVTIQSVADRAGVSIGTVSRVLNQDPSVSPEMCERVQNSVQQLGYKPLRKRKADARKETGLAGKTVGLLTIGMDPSLSHLPVITAAIDGIRQACHELGANLRICDAPDPATRPMWIKGIQCDAWLIKGAMQGDLIAATHPDLLQQMQRNPCVWFHGRPGGAPGFGVGTNDWEVGAIAAKHLHEKGHREVAFLSPKNNHALLKHREHGFVAHCEKLGMKCEVHSRNLQAWTFPLERPKSLAAVSSLLEKILSTKKKTSAIFVPADSIAVLLYRALAERGLRIPEDLSVISANREETLIAGLYPSLTTVDVHARQVGREAVALLDRSLQPGSDLPPQDVQISPTLEIGESVHTL
ncbi:MAG: LacI family transcriptional regulator [Verrucomicrobiales bacterium]|nr:LacI family transcriptional regulator [Verrucomicrobiales bacterium]